jgi:hypothetical protein
MSVNRRDFLLLRVAGRGAVELSCERLLMKYVDAQLNGTTAELFARLERELDRAGSVKLVDPEWLARDDFRAELARVLDVFRANGGSLIEASGPA